MICKQVKTYICVALTNHYSGFATNCGYKTRYK